MKMTQNTPKFNPGAGKVYLSSLFRDPFVAKAFRRGEGDTPEDFALPVRPKPVAPSAMKAMVAA